MALKERSLPPSTSTSATPSWPSEDSWSGPWGVIVPVHHPLETLRICLGGTGRPVSTWSFPYRTLAGWTWKEADPEILVIRTGEDEVEIKGYGLKRLVDALDAGRLQSVREQGQRHASATGADLHILAITVHSNRDQPSANSSRRQTGK